MAESKPNPFAEKLRIKRDFMDDPIYETQKFAMYKNLSMYILKNKETGRIVTLDNDAALALMDLHTELQELYLK